MIGYKLRLYDIFLLAVVILIYLFSEDTNNNKYCFACIVAFFVVSIIRKNGSKTRITLNNDLLIYCMFFIYATISLLWSKQWQIETYKFLGIDILLVFGIYIYLGNVEKIKTVLFGCWLGGIAASIRIISFYGFTFSSSRRLLMTGIYNSNAIGVAIVFSTMAAIVLNQLCLKKLRVGLMITECIFLYVIIISGSKTATIGFLLSVIGSLVINSNNSLIVLRNIIIGIFTIIIAWLFIQNNDWAYNLIGWRFDELLKQAYGQESDDAIRFIMTQRGLSYFLNRPLFGYGLANFRVQFLQDYGVNHYAHNNFIETLVDFGIIGFIMYYYRYYKVIRNCNSKRKKAIHYKKIMLFTIFWTILVIFTDFGRVSYYNIVYQLVWVIMIKLSSIEEIYEGQCA